MTNRKDTLAGHLVEIEKKSTESVKKFENHMKGTMFREFDKVTKEKINQDDKEIDEI